jgi:hypothetical protein
MAGGNSNGKHSTNGRMKSVRERFADSASVQAAVNDSMREVRILHKRMGVPLVGVVNGKMVSIPPDEIQVDDTPATKPE